MKAAIYTRYGPPEVVRIADVPKPTPKADEVLVKVNVTTVNRTDTGFRSMEYFIARFFQGMFKPKRQILGSELAGEVVAVGNAVKEFKVGDRVFGLHPDHFGAHAEYVAIKETKSIVTTPSTATDEEVVALCDGPWLALNCLQAMKIQPGQTILINGASGSIGSSAVQLAKHFGAVITAVTNTKNVAMACAHGATTVYDYLKEDFTKMPGEFDLIFDAVGMSSFFKCKHLLKPQGIYISTELGFMSQNPFLALWSVAFGKKKVKFPIPRDKKEHILFFKKLIEKGELRAVIDRQYDLDDIVEAHRYVDSKEKTGSVLVKMRG